MALPKPTLSWPPKFLDPPLFLVLSSMRKYVSYLDVSCSTVMNASDLALTFSNRHSVLCDTDNGHGSSVDYIVVDLTCLRSRCYRPEVDCSVGCCYEEVHYEKDLSKLVQQLGGSHYLNLVRSLSFSAIILGTCILKRALTFLRVIVTLSFVSVFMPWEYLLSGLTSNGPPPFCRTFQVLYWNSGLVTRIGGSSFPFCSGASVLAC